MEVGKKGKENRRYMPFTYNLVQSNYNINHSYLDAGFLINIVLCKSLFLESPTYNRMEISGAWQDALPSFNKILLTIDFRVNYISDFLNYKSFRLGHLSRQSCWNYSCLGCYFKTESLLEIPCRERNQKMVENKSLQN